MQSSSHQPPAVARSGRPAGLLFLACLVACAATGLPGGAAARPGTPVYTMTDVGSPGGGVSYGFGINAAGEVVGISDTTKTARCEWGAQTCSQTIARPFSWVAGKMTDLGSLGGIISEALAVNRSGDVAGTSNGDAFVVHDGKMADLGPGAAAGINDLGEIAGSGPGGAFVISGGRRTRLADLSSYGGGRASGASGINDLGQVAGTSDTAQGYEHAVVWSNATITDLGTLGGTQSAAYAVNDLGQAVGWADTATGATHVFLWSGATMTDLGTFGLDPVAESVNNHGVIVGWSDAGPWVWSAGTFHNLSGLVPPGSGFTLNNATAINDHGQIVATGYNSAGQTRAFLLTPTR
jgi:probable HAF family extracellular repeat protein